MRVSFKVSLFSLVAWGLSAASMQAGAQVDQKSQANNPVLDRLERGEVISSKSGQAFLLQSIVKKDASAVLKSLTGDLKTLSKVIPQVAFAKPMLTESGKKILYLKLRGLGDGLGILLEVKQGASESFANARALIRSADLLPLRDTQDSVNDVSDGMVLKAVEERNKTSADATRIIGGDQVLVLEGPLNKIMAMPNLRLTAEISVAPYTIMEKSSGIIGGPAPKVMSYSLLQVRMAVGNQVRIGGELGDYKGFGDQRLELAKLTGEELVRNLRLKIESL